MPLAIVLDPFGALAAPWPSAEAAVPALAVLAGLLGAWLNSVHPPPALAHGHDPAPAALFVL